MKAFIIICMVIFVLGFSLSACSTPPTEEMKKAQDAVILAESNTDAVKYAGNTLIRAKDALTKMQNEADAKRYDSAKSSAEEAVILAERAIAEGRTGAARAIDEATSLINNLASLLMETSNALNAAREVKDIQLDFDSLFRDFNLAQKTYDEALKSFQTENFRDTIEKGQTIRSLLSDINYRLSQATQATSRKQ